MAVTTWPFLFTLSPLVWVYASAVYTENPNNLKLLTNFTGDNEVTRHGCYTPPIDKSKIQLQSKSKYMSPILCVNFCWRKDFKLAIIMRTEECYCGNEVLRQMPLRRCNYMCPGATDQKCGGRGGVASLYGTGHVDFNYELMESMYNDIVQLKSTRKREVTQEMKRFDGGKCYEWTPSASKYMTFTNLNLGSKLCVVFCFHYKFVYAMTRYISMCYCTSQTPKSWKTATCTLKCGRGGTMCGGGTNVYSMWFTGHTNSNDFIRDPRFKRPNAFFPNWKMFFKSTAKITRTYVKRKVVKSPITKARPQNAMASKVTINTDTSREARSPNAMASKVTSNTDTSREPRPGEPVPSTEFNDTDTISGITQPEGVDRKVATVGFVSSGAVLVALIIFLVYWRKKGNKKIAEKKEEKRKDEEKRHKKKKKKKHRSPEESESKDDIEDGHPKKKKKKKKKKRHRSPELPMTKDDVDD